MMEFNVGNTVEFIGDRFADLPYGLRGVIVEIADPAASKPYGIAFVGFARLVWVSPRFLWNCSR